MLLLWRLFQWASMANALVLMEKHEGANTWWCFTRSIHCHRSSHAMPFSLASLALCISLPLIHSHTFVINIISVLYVTNQKCGDTHTLGGVTGMSYKVHDPLSSRPKEILHMNEKECEQKRQKESIRRREQEKKNTHRE